MSTDDIAPDDWSVAEAARILGRDESTLRRMIYRGALESSLSTGVYRIPHSEVERLIAQREEERRAAARRLAWARRAGAAYRAGVHP